MNRTPGFKSSGDSGSDYGNVAKFDLPSGAYPPGTPEEMGDRSCSAPVSRLYDSAYGVRESIPAKISSAAAAYLICIFCP